MVLGTSTNFVIFGPSFFFSIVRCFIARFYFYFFPRIRISLILGTKSVRSFAYFTWNLNKQIFANRVIRSIDFCSHFDSLACLRSGRCDSYHELLRASVKKRMKKILSPSYICVVKRSERVENTSVGLRSLSLCGLASSMTMTEQEKKDRAVERFAKKIRDNLRVNLSL